MVFSSYIFIFVFLPVTLAGYYLLSKLPCGAYQRLFLIAASLCFYAYLNPAYLAVIAVSILVNYALSVLMVRGGGASVRSACFYLGILFNIGLLGYFKYYNFFLGSLNSLFSSSFTMRHIMLPLGISFFTFQQLVYLTDLRRGEACVGGFIDYCLFVLFFPQLVSGPIVLYGELAPQFGETERRYLNADNMAAGLYIFCIGLFKKLVIADTLALFADNGFALTQPGCAAAWAASLSFTLQIYFDFSGYSDMAVGTARMFNFDLPANFLSPYLSESVSVFWRRWHITLGRALTRLVYWPLGGSRRGMPRTCLNLMATFLVSGLWHGASWTFVLWGALHGLCTVIERLFAGSLEKLPKLLRIGGTFLAVNALWVLFRAESFDGAMGIYRAMLSFSGFELQELAGLVFDGFVNFPAFVDIAYLLGLFAVLLFVVWGRRSSWDMLRDFRPGRGNLAFTAALFVISVLHLSRESVFIYFNF